MDLSTSVQSSNQLKKSSSNAPRRGSNPSNLTGPSGNDSGITSPRAESIAGEPFSSQSQGKRRPSVSKPSVRNVPYGTSSSSDPKNVSLFAHLPQVTITSTSPTSSITSQLLKNSKDALIHPAIIKLGLAFAEYRIMGAAERCKQLLLAFKQVYDAIIIL